MALRCIIIPALLIWSGLKSGTFAADSAAPARTIWKVLPGTYAKEPRVARLIEIADREHLQALRSLEEKWELTMGAAAVSWRFDTAGVAAEPVVRGAKSSTVVAPVEAFELGRTSFGAREVIVTLPARKFLFEPKRVIPVILHESVHAIYATRLGTEQRYHAVPFWFREGVALLISGEGDVTLRERIAYTVFKGEAADSFLQPIGSEGRQTRAQAYTTAAWIHQSLGHKTFRVLLKAVADGRPLDRTLQQISGNSADSLLSRALPAARRWVRRLLPPERERTFARSVRELSEGRAGATHELEKFLARDPRGPMADTVRYLLAREGVASAPEESNLAGPREHLEVLLKSPGTLWRPEALVLLGQCYLRDGRRDKARRSWREVLIAFGEDRPVAERARRFIARLDATPRGN